MSFSSIPDNVTTDLQVPDKSIRASQNQLLKNVNIKNFLNTNKMYQKSAQKFVENKKLLLTVNDVNKENLTKSGPPCAQNQQNRNFQLMKQRLGDQEEIPYQQTVRQPPPEDSNFDEDFENKEEDSKNNNDNNKFDEENLNETNIDESTNSSVNQGGGINQKLMRLKMQDNHQVNNLGIQYINSKNIKQNSEKKQSKNSQEIEELQKSLEDQAEEEKKDHQHIKQFPNMQQKLQKKDDEQDQQIKKKYQRKINGQLLFSPRTINIDSLNYAVNMSSKGISDLKDLDINEQQLNSIDLSLNKFTEIPQEIYRFINLKILKLDNNILKVIPPSLFTSLRLEIFSIMNNLIKYIPEQIIYQKDCLVSLNLAQNHIVDLEKNIFQLKKLKTLCLSSNNFDILPSEFLNFEYNLRELAIDWYKYCQPTQKEIAKGKKLQDLFDQFKLISGDVGMSLHYFLHTFSENKPYEPKKISTGPKNMNQLHHAVEHEDMSVLRYLIKENLPLSNQLDSEGYTPLGLAIRIEKYSCAKLLVFSNCEVNIGGGPTRSCLSLGILKQQYYLVKDLLKLGANANQQDREGNTPLHYLFTQFNKNKEVATEIGNLLLDYKAQPNTLNNDKLAPIHIAARSGSIPGIMFILNYNKKKKTEYFQIDKTGGEDNFSILQFAAHNGYVQLVKTLLRECPETFTKSMAVNVQINMTRKNNTISKLMKIAEKEFITKHVLKNSPDRDFEQLAQLKEQEKKQFLEEMYDQNDLTISQKLRKRPLTPCKPQYFHMQKQPCQGKDIDFFTMEDETLNQQNIDDFDDQDCEDEMDITIEVDIDNDKFVTQNDEANVCDDIDNNEQTLGVVNETYHVLPSQNKSKKMIQDQKNKCNKIVKSNVIKNQFKQKSQTSPPKLKKTNLNSILYSEYGMMNESFEDFDEDDFLEETEWPLNHRKFMPYISTMEVGTSNSNNDIVSTQDRQSTSQKSYQENIERKIENIINNCYLINEIRSRILTKRILPVKLSCLHSLYNLHFQILDFLSNYTNTPHYQFENVGILNVLKQIELKDDYKLVFLLNNAFQIIEICKEVYGIISSQQNNKFKATSQYAEQLNFNIKEDVDCQVLQYFLASMFPSSIILSQNDNILAQYTVYQEIYGKPGQQEKQYQKGKRQFFITDSGFEKFFPHEEEQNQLENSINVYKLEKKRKNPLLHQNYE